MGSARDVWELSRAALSDEDGLVVVIKIYMDESGTHDGSPVVTVGAYFGKPKVWREFTKQWNFRKRPIKIFHSTDCANFRGEFEGWKLEDRDALVANLTGCLRGSMLGGMAAGINMRDFNEALSARPDLIELFGSPYVTCFQWVVQQIVDIADNAHGHQKLAFFHEQNDFQVEALKAFEWVRQSRKHHRGDMTITFGAKDQFTPLQAADMLAYEANKRLRDPTKTTVRRSLEALDPDRKRVSIVGYAKPNMPWLVRRLDLMAREISTFGHIVTLFQDQPPS